MKVKEICDLQNGRAFKPTDWATEGIPIVRIQNLNDERAPFNYYLGEYSVIHEINNGELLFSWSGTPGTSFGAFRWFRGKGVLNQHIFRVLPKIDVDKEYLKYALNGNINLIIEKAHGGVGLQHITKKELDEIDIPIVSKEKQLEIVECLLRVENVISLRKKEMEELDDLIKSRFVELFGDPIRNPKGWKVATIGDIVTDVRYGTSKPAVEGGKYPYLRMNNLTVDGHLDLNDLKYIDIPDDEIEKCVVRKGDVLFNRTNSIELVGKTAVFDLLDDMVIAGYIIRVRLTQKMLPEVLAQYMNLEALKDILRGMAKGAVNQANINAQELQSIKIYIPEMELQKQFVEMKEQIDKLKSEVQKSLDETQLLMDSLMQKYFG